MKILIIIFTLILILFLADKVGLWLERKGYLYYRHNKPQGGALGSTLLELNAQLSPSNRYIVEMKQNEVRFKKSEADASGKSVGPN
ncbi:hypothetical protein [Legionella drancourtii]|uniref:Uncharacterized protein n=1 Tax=Legionella drancourtii LLAP12 TaxID=658187 RepID=G9EL01_9GAMM|nr:hypothetical protein [Legionella drancourtii]EHL32112.1 hypothetical protein LDG_5897 [Legionella drancourtii LLAP12]